MAVVGNPRTVTDVVEVRSVPVAIKVVTTSWANEQVRHEINVQVDRVRRAVAVVGRSIYRLSELHGRETGAAVLKLVVPVSRSINASVGSPNVTCRNPNPVFNHWLPMSGVPAIIVVLKLPIAGNIKMFFARRNGRRSLIDRSWRRWQVAKFFLRLLSPKSRDPNVPRPFGVPVAGHPASLWRNVAPNSADPNEVRLCVIPSPVSRNPLNVVSVWLIFRGNFVDHLWRSFENWLRGLRIGMVG